MGVPYRKRTEAGTQPLGKSRNLKKNDKDDGASAPLDITASPSLERANFIGEKESSTTVRQAFAHDCNLCRGVVGPVLHKRSHHCDSQALHVVVCMRPDRGGTLCYALRNRSAPVLRVAADVQHA